MIFFSVVIAVIPLFIAGRSMIRMSQDELKSSANEELSRTATSLATAVDERFADVWVRPLELTRNAIDSDYLSPQEKLSILQSAIQEIADVVALQLTVEGIDPALVSKEAFSERLSEAELNPAQTLRTPPEGVPLGTSAPSISTGDLVYLPASDNWLLTVFLPLSNGLLGRSATLSARINLARLRTMIAEDPMMDKGAVSVVDQEGRRLLSDERTSLMDRAIVRQAVETLASGTRTTTVFPYKRANEEAYLGAVAFTTRFPWAIVVEMGEGDAYMAVAQMRRSLWLWILLGLAIAVAGALFVAFRISKPILAIEQVTHAVSLGDLSVRVEGVNMKDEIGDLAQRVNEMIQGLIERFNLSKFVSGGTLEAVKGAQDQGVKLGGDRRRVTVLFSDIRGFTAFSDKVEPEVVVDMLNTYLRHQAQIVRQFQGDIDKYVGDELLAVFQGDEMALHAVRCGIAIQKKMAELLVEYPDWNLHVGIGINTGEVVMGAMGSEERMDYTILGDTVNVGARLCSKAAPKQVLISSTTQREIAEDPEFQIGTLPPISVKGKPRPLEVYEILNAVGPVAGPA